jgi:hypothetical protein
VYAPTQVGKTHAIAKMIELSFEKNPNLPVIISCDNKNDQLQQIFERIKNYFIQKINDKEIILFEVSKTKFQKIFVENINKKNMIIFCLDNATQINKLANTILNCIHMQRNAINKLLLIHDEADVITKDYDVNIPSHGQCKSHQLWISLVDLFTQNQLKRVFVTATPENIVYKYVIDNCIRLNVSNNYIGYDKVNFNAVDEFNEYNVNELAVIQQNRMIREKENGVTLIAWPRKIQDGQDVLFESLISNPEITCVVNTYNGNGIVARVNNPKFTEAVLKRTEGTSILVSQQEYRQNVWDITGMAIKDFYEICREIGSGVVITIGMDLMCRGISFVSSSKTVNTVAATVLIYCPGETRHGVGLNQAIGRITGTARPDLPRYVFSTQKIIDDYISFNRNQEQYIQAILDNGGKMTPKEMIAVELNHKIGRNLDRAPLRLNPTYKANMLPVNNIHVESSNEFDDEIFADNEHTIHGVKKVNIKKWLRNSTNSTISKMVRFLYKNENVTNEISFEEFKQGIDYHESNNQFRVNIINANSVNSRYGKLWIASNNCEIIRINPYIKDYINSLN